MATIQGQNSVAGNSITLPTHAVGDLIIICAYRDGSTTQPTKPASGATVPACADINTVAGQNINVSRTAYFEATASLLTMLL